MARITLRSQFAYLGDSLVGMLFLAVVLFVFANLWRTTFAGETRIDGYTLPQVIWYLVFTETIVLSTPRLHSQIDAEVKAGDIAYRLNKPYQYLGFHYAGFMAETLVRAGLALVLGGAVAWLTVGPIPFGIGRVLPVLSAFWLAQSVQFCLAAGVGLMAFWMEDTAGLFLLVDRMRWILGGLLIPMELLPEGLAQVARWLPFQDMVYGPARLFAAYHPAEYPALAGRLLLWLGGALLLVVLLYRRGTRRLELNGG